MNKKAIILILLIILLCGCSKNDEINYIQDRSCIKTYCDKENNVEYFIMTCNRMENGITIRLNKKGEVIHCEDN